MLLDFSIHGFQMVVAQLFALETMMSLLLDLS